MRNCRFEMRNVLLFYFRLTILWSFRQFPRASTKDDSLNELRLAKAGLPLANFFRTKRLFSWRKFLIIENIKNMPRIKSEAVIQRCSVNKVFLEISQNSQENTCARVSFLIKLQPSALWLYLKRDSGAGVFLWILWSL